MTKTITFEVPTACEEELRRLCSTTGLNEEVVARQLLILGMGARTYLDKSDVESLRNKTISRFDGRSFGQMEEEEFWDGIRTYLASEAAGQRFNELVRKNEEDIKKPKPHIK